jgi:SAM-dependent methyltransferase
VERKEGRAQLNPLRKVADFGCGNGRNLVFLSEQFGMRGVGYDISREAIAQAVELSNGLPIEYEVRSIEGTFPNLTDESITLALDMMTSHFLKLDEREKLISEIARVLKPGGWLFLKTFLKDEDEHAQRLIKENPAEEKNSYIHPKIGLAEHVFTEDEIEKSLKDKFTIEKITKSHGHLKNGQAFKRRSMSIYAQRNFD